MNNIKVSVATIALLAVVLMVISVVPSFTPDDTSAETTEATVDGMTFELTETEEGASSVRTAKLTNGKELTGDVVIPGTISNNDKTYVVTEIDSFAKNKNITGLVIPDSVKTLKNSVFEKCTKLVSVTANGVTIIPNSCFNGCTKLTTVSMTGKITDIGNNAFKGCSSLKTVPDMNSVTNIGSSAFYGCSELGNLTLTDTETIGSSAFYGCKAFTSITIKKVSIIPATCFSGCSLLETVSTSDKLTEIGNNAFVSCTKLTGISDTTSVKTVGNNAFQNCSALTTMSVADGASIGNSAFKGCSSLKTIENIDNAAALGTKPFEGTSLSDAIYASNGTTLAYVPASVETLVVKDGVTAISANAAAGSASLKTLTLPNTLETIGNNAFQNCTALTSITIPASVTNIGIYAFNGCSAIESVTFADGSLIETIAQNAFSGCTSLSSVTIPDTVTLIGANAFNNTAIPDAITYNGGKILVYVPQTLTSFTVPNGVETIFNYAFSGCAVESVSIPASVTTIGMYAFNGSGLKTIEIPNTVSVIDNYAFSDCAELNNVVLPSNLTYIATSLFKNCTSLTTISIPSYVTNVGVSAFDGSGLVSITIPASVTSLGNYCFRNCADLKSVAFESSVTFGTGVFYGSGLETFTFPEGTVATGGSMFYGCLSLASVNMNSGLKTIAASTFTGCSKLGSVSIPESVNEIGTGAFQNCTELTKVTIPKNVASVGANAFSASGIKNVTVECAATFGNYIFNGCILETLTIGDCSSFNAYSLAGASVSEFIVSHATSFNGTKAFEAESVSALLKTDAENNCKYIDVKMSDGESYTNGKMMIFNDNTDGTLHIGADYVAIGCNIFDETYSNITVDGTNTHFQNADGIIYSGDELVYVPSTVKNLVIREGTKTINPYSIRICGELESISFPESLAEICKNAIGEKIAPETIIFNSSPIMHDSTFAPNDITKIYFRYGTYDAGRVGDLQYNGYYAKTTNGNVFFKLSNTNVSITVVSEADSLAFDIIPLTGYDESAVTVNHNGVMSKTMASAGISINGTLIDGMYVLRNITGDTTVNISGVKINTYDITLPKSEGYKVSPATEIGGIEHGQTVDISIRINPGFKASEGYRLSIDGIGIDPVFFETGYYIYSLTVDSDKIVTVDGVVSEDTIDITFDSGNGVTSVQKISKNTTAVPETATKVGNVFAGWYSDTEYTTLFDFSEPIANNTTIYAKWLASDSAIANISFSAENGSIVAIANGNDTVINGGNVMVGSRITFEFTPDLGYEAVCWIVNGAQTEEIGNICTLDITGDATIAVESQYHMTGSFINHVDTLTPTGNGYELVWSVGPGGSGGMMFTNMIFSPAIIEDYVYAKFDNYLLKVDIYTGNIVKQVATAVSFNGYYQYLTVGNGLIFDSITGNVYDQDLNQVFVIPKTTTKAYYNNDVFYVESASAKIYAYSAVDEDRNSPTNKQSLLWEEESDVLITQYEGGTTMLFEKDYFVVVEVSDSARFLASHSLKTGAEIDKIELTKMAGLNFGKGYLSIADGTVYVTAYGTGLFESDTTSGIYNIASVKIDDRGLFDDVTLRFFSSGFGEGFSSAFVMNGDYGYVNASGTLAVYDINTMKIVATAEAASAHGSIAISTGYAGKTYAYLLPYDQTKVDVYIYEHVFSDPTTLNVVKASGLITPQYSSQQAHFGPDGQMIFVNDSGKLFCIATTYDITSSSCDNGSFEVSATSSAYGRAITVVPNPSELYGVLSVSYTQTDGTVTTVESNDGIYSFKMPASDITISVEFANQYRFYLYNSVNGENSDINGWYVGCGTGTVDALCNALTDAGIEYTGFTNSTTSLMFSSSKYISDWTTGAWVSDGDKYGIQWAIWNYNATDGWHLGNVLGEACGQYQSHSSEETDKIFIISHEQYLDVDGVTAASQGIDNSKVWPAAADFDLIYNGSTGSYENADQAIRAWYKAYAATWMPDDLADYGLSLKAGSDYEDADEASMDWMLGIEPDKYTAPAGFDISNAQYGYVQLAPADLSSAPENMTFGPVLIYDIDATVTNTAAETIFNLTLTKESGIFDVDDARFLVIAGYENGIFINVYSKIDLNADGSATEKVMMSTAGLQTVSIQIISGTPDGEFSTFGDYVYSVAEA